MNDKDKLSHRLALLEGVEIAPADLDAIAEEVEDNLRVIAELEEFAKDTPWISLQTQPAGKKA